jgi:hypothetical protein
MTKRDLPPQRHLLVCFHGDDIVYRALEIQQFRFEFRSPPLSLPILFGTFDARVYSERVEFENSFPCFHFHFHPWAMSKCICYYNIQAEPTSSHITFSPPLPPAIERSIFPGISFPIQHGTTSPKEISL